MSLSAFRYARLITWNDGSIGRTFSTSSSQRDDIHAHGHSGSNQKSTGVRSCSVLSTVSSVVWVMADLLVGGAGRARARVGRRRHLRNQGARFGYSPSRCEDAPMPGTNLTRDEARARAELLDVESYSVELDLDPASTTTFGSTTVIRFRSSRTGESTFADLVGATIREMSLNGRLLDPAEVYAEHRIRLDDLQADNELRVVADCAYSHTGEGLHRFVDPADDRTYLYTQMEVPDARRVFTTFEQPDLKSVFTFTVTAPSHWKVVSVSPTPEPEPSADGADGTVGMAVWRFPTTERL